MAAGITVQEQTGGWIRRSPPLVTVLDWHRKLCGTCGLRHCPEYAEIIEEYGAGPYGVSVFFPAI